MAHRPRKEMIAETRAKLVAAARQAFGSVGYAQASMDDFTAAAGLTRGALYHHFGDKKGLLEAVVVEVDAEMSERLRAVSARAGSRWQGFVDECKAYIEMALEPEIQRIIHCDGPAVLGDPWRWPTHNGCISSMTTSLNELAQAGVIGDIDPEAAARLLNGAMLNAGRWIANSEDPEVTSRRAIKAFEALLNGLLAKAPARTDVPSSKPAATAER